MSIYDLLAIAIVGAGGFVLGVVTTIKVNTSKKKKTHQVARLLKNNQNNYIIRGVGRRDW